MNRENQQLFTQQKSNWSFGHYRALTSLLGKIYITSKNIEMCISE